MKKYFLLTSIVFSFLGFAQYEEAFKKVREATNVEGLKALQQRFSQEQKERDARLEKYFSENPTKQKRWEDGEVTFEIYDVVDGVEQIVRTANANSAITSRTNKLYNGGGLGLNVEGQGMTAFVWDNGGVRDSHVEFPNFKILNWDNAASQFHSTHVTGTIVANGLNISAKGIAHKASAGCYDWTNDLLEMATELENATMLVSNHSYTRSPNPLNSWFFGAYSSMSRDFDLLTNNAPNYLPIVAAGNSRNDFNNPTVASHLSLKAGYDLIYGFQTAKNILTVGAINEVLNYSSNWDVIMSDFSSWGPTDDGRIKPEIVTKGVQVFSTGHNSNNHYSNANGTSMASPAITGSALLLQQHYFNVKNSFMKAATLKGLILHTADEAGSYDGPDYEFGWGLANIEKSAITINNSSTSNSLIAENILTQGEIKEYIVRSDINGKIQASISWNDPAGVANTGITDPSTLNLVNDLDIRILKESQTYFPWTLSPASPWNAAMSTMDNFRDNFERIDINNVVADQLYTIRVTHKGNLTNGQQNFSLIVTGINEVLSSNKTDFDKNIFSIYPNPTENFININSKINNYFVELYSIEGQKLLSIDSNNNYINKYDISHFANGVYIMKIYTISNKIETFKIVKK